MLKLSVTIDRLLGVSSNVKEKARNYIPELIRFKINRFLYRVGDYVVRIVIVKLPARTINRLTDRETDRLRKIKNRDILVSCTCKFWKYGGPDFNAFILGYSERTKSNLQPPDERDPNRKNFICQHAYAALKKFRDEIKTVD